MIVCVPSYNIGRPIYIWQVGREQMGILEKDTHTHLRICK